MTTRDQEENEGGRSPKTNTAEGLEVECFWEQVCRGRGCFSRKTVAGLRCFAVAAVGSSSGVEWQAGSREQGTNNRGGCTALATKYLFGVPGNGASTAAERERDAVPRRQGL